MDVLKPYCTNNLDDCVKFYCKISVVTAPTQNKNLSDAGLYQQVYELHYDRYNAMPIGTATVIKSYYFPPFENIGYIRSSEPHNGSVIVHKLGPVKMATVNYELMWKSQGNLIGNCLDCAFKKTMFTLCRDRAMCESSYRISMKCEAPGTEISKLIIDNEEEVGEMAVLEEDYTEGTVPKSSNSSNSSAFIFGQQATTQSSVPTSSTSLTTPSQTVTTTPPPLQTQRVQNKPPPPPVQDDDDTSNMAALDDADSN